MIAGIAGTTWQAIRATQQSNRAGLAEAAAITEAEKASEEAARAGKEAKKARTEAAIATAVREFLETDLLNLAGTGSQSKAGIPPDPYIKLRTIVDRAADRLENKFVDQPEVKAAIFVVLGNVYYSLGEYQKAESLNREALEIRRHIFGSEHPDVLSIMHDLAVLLGKQDRYKDAETIERQILEIRRRVLGLEHDKTLKSMNNLANSLSGQGQFNEAEQLIRESLQIQRRVSGLEAPGTVRGMNDLAIVLGHRGKFKEAETVLNIESSESSATVRELPRGETTDRDPQMENSEKTPTN